MKKRFLAFFLTSWFIVCTIPAVAAKVATLPGIRRPDFLIQVDNDELLLVECASIYIYSLKDYSLKTKFGKRGEGPQEFKVHPAENVHLSVEPDYLMIGSGGKASFFTRTGTFIKEVPLRDRGLILPFSGKYLEIGRTFEDKKGYHQINLLDSEFNIIKEVCRSPLHIQRNKITFPNATFFCRAYGKQIYVNYSTGDFVIDCFDYEGKPKFTIENKEFQKPPVTPGDEKRIHQSLRKSYGEWYIKNKPRIKIKSHWPAIGMFFIDNNIIYLLTYVKKEVGNQDYARFMLYDIEGKFLKKIYLPVVERHIFAPYPLTIKNSKLYQIVENPDTEEWELFITNIE